MQVKPGEMMNAMMNKIISPLSALLCRAFPFGLSRTAFFRVCAASLAVFSVLTAACGWRPASGPASEEEIAAVQKQLSQLETAADRIEDANAVKRLQRAYGYYLDRGLWNDAADLFASDATLEIGLDGVYVGRKRIRQYLLALGEGSSGLKYGQLNEHIILQPAVHVSDGGRKAKGRWRSLIMTGQLGKNAFWGEGTYENEYVKEDDIWKIAKLHWYQTFMVPYAGGWAENKDSTGGIYVSKQLPPDRPPSEQYEVWPGVYTPPFHYKNPVSVPTENIADANPAIAALAHRIRLLQDTDEIENLISMYGYYLDKLQWDLLIDLFAEDSTMEISQRGIYVGKKSGRRALELFGTQNIKANHLHNHIQTQPVIHVAPSGQRAWVRSRAVSQLGTYGEIGIWGDGVYENELIKENGIWKFKKDHVYTTFFAPYDQGWAMAPRPTPKASKEIPPDLPPSEIYESFPDIYIPPFHYSNPVTGDTTAAEPEIRAGQIPAEAEADFMRLNRKVTRLEDVNAIENLQRIYGFYVDKQLWQDAADLFASDATLEIGGRGVFIGKSRVLGYLKRLAPGGLTRGKLFNHIQLQPIVHVAADGTRAEGRWRFLAEFGEYRKRATWGGGSYENEYVKEGGVWKFKTLYACFRFCTPYEDGWGKTAIANPRPEKDFPPDRPPTVLYDSFPSTYVAPFHYKNPVTQK